jgi:CheY-like chemotaxis protein
VQRIEIEKRFGASVRSWRTRLRISQEELSFRSGLQRSYISDIERGARNVSLKSVEKIADALGISMADLFLNSSDRAGVQPLTTDEMVDILLVEDSQRDADLTVEALKNARVSNRIYVVHDGAAALDFLFCTGDYAYRRPDDHPKIILLDLHLPKIDGLEVLRRIKADPRTRLIPVVVLTGSKDQRDIATSKQLGAENYIVKPVDFENFNRASLELSLQWALLKAPTT